MVGVELVDVEALRQQIAQAPFELYVIDPHLHPFALVDQAADVQRPTDRAGELRDFQRAGDESAEAGEEKARAALGAREEPEGGAKEKEKDDKRDAGPFQEAAETMLFGGGDGVIDQVLP